MAPHSEQGIRELLDRLVEAGTLLTSELSLEGVLQRVVEIAGDLLEAEYAAIGVLGDDGRTIERFLTTGIDRAQRDKIGHHPTGKGVLGTVIRQATSIRVDDIARHPDSAGFPANHPGMSSFLGVPIRGKQGGIFGNLYVTNKRGGPFTEEDEHVANLLAAQASAALENARLHEASTRLLEEVQQLQRGRERFFATVNHELRNAIAGVYGWAEMLVRKRDPVTVPKAAYEVLDSAEKASSLVNDLLDLSRLDEDRLRPKMADVNIETIIRRAAGLVTPAARGKNVTIAIDTQLDKPNCHTDQHRVEQILINILGNAIRHSPNGGTVTVAVRSRDDEGICQLMVDDEGSGIPEDDLDRIFDVYYSNPGDDGNGTGLGLPLSRRLARLLGGDLVAENLRPGARFSLTLPHRRGE